MVPLWERFLWLNVCEWEKVVFIIFKIKNCCYWGLSNHLFPWHTLIGSPAREQSWHRGEQKQAYGVGLGDAGFLVRLVQTPRCIFWGSSPTVLLPLRDTGGLGTRRQPAVDQVVSDVNVVPISIILLWLDLQLVIATSFSVLFIFRRLSSETGRKDDNKTIEIIWMDWLVNGCIIFLQNFIPQLFCSK